MNFDYTDEQNAIRDSLSKWAQQQYDFDKRREALKSDDAWKSNWATFAELGLLMAPLPEEYGGLGGGPIDTLVIMEEFGKGLVSHGMLLATGPSDSLHLATIDDSVAPGSRLK